MEYDDIRDRIFALLKERKLPQKDFALKIGVSAQTVTDWKKGKSNSFAEKISAISSALDTSPVWLTFGVGKKNMSEKEKLEIATQNFQRAVDTTNELNLSTIDVWRKALQHMIKQGVFPDILQTYPNSLNDLASFLGVTVSELLGGTGPQNLAIQDQPYLVMRYNSLPPKVQEEVMAFIEFKVAQQKEKK